MFIKPVPDGRKNFVRENVDMRIDHHWKALWNEGSFLIVDRR
jgi:hypothetical protein